MPRLALMRLLPIPPLPPPTARMRQGRAWRERLLTLGVGGDARALGRLVGNGRVTVPCGRGGDHRGLRGGASWWKSDHERLKSGGVLRASS